MANTTASHTIFVCQYVHTDIHAVHMHTLIGTHVYTYVCTYIYTVAINLDPYTSHYYILDVYVCTYIIYQLHNIQYKRMYCMYWKTIIYIQYVRMHIHTVDTYIQTSLLYITCIPYLQPGSPCMRQQIKGSVELFINRGRGQVCGMER